MTRSDIDNVLEEIDLLLFEIKNPKVDNKVFAMRGSRLIEEQIRVKRMDLRIVENHFYVNNPVKSQHVI